MRTETEIRLERQKAHLLEIKDGLKEVGQAVEEALKNGDTEKATMLYVEHYRMAREYFRTEDEVEYLKFICED